MYVAFCGLPEDELEEELEEELLEDELLEEDELDDDELDELLELDELATEPGCPPHAATASKLISAADLPMTTTAFGNRITAFGNGIIVIYLCRGCRATTIWGYHFTFCWVT